MCKLSLCYILWVTCLYCQSAAHQHGVALYRQQNYQEAVTTLEAAAKDEPPDSADFKESALLIGQSLFVLNQAPKAIPWLEKVGPLNNVNFMLGYAYFLNHENEKSEAAFARVFNQNADSAGGRLIAGQMLLKRAYEKEAAEEINKSLAMNPKLPEGHFILGEIAITQGRLEDGVAEMSKELEMNPDFAMAWYRRGDAYARQGNLNAAIDDLKRAIWLNQSYSGPYILLGKCYFNQKNYAKAESALRSARDLDPQNYSATYLLARTLMAENKTDEARSLLEKLKTMDRDR
jgi:tetratricopeptide (TPR) repeat protein